MGKNSLKGIFKSIITHVMHISKEDIQLRIPWLERLFLVLSMKVRDYNLKQITPHFGTR